MAILMFSTVVGVIVVVIYATATRPCRTGQHWHRHWRLRRRRHIKGPQLP